MEHPRIGVILSTIRPGRFADTAARWFLDLASRRTDLAFEVLDLRDYPLPFFGAADATGSSAVDRWQAKLNELDGVVFITAEYQHSIPGVLKNALDYVGRELYRKPVAFVGYGGVGAARAIQQLKLICLELKAVPIPVAVHVGLEVLQAVKEKTKALSDFDFLNGRAATLLEELAWWAHTLKAARTTS